MTPPEREAVPKGGKDEDIPRPRTAGRHVSAHPRQGRANCARLLILQQPLPGIKEGSGQGRLPALCLGTPGGMKKSSGRAGQDSSGRFSRLPPYLPKMPGHHAERVDHSVANSGHFFRQIILANLQICCIYKPLISALFGHTDGNCRK